ncbi:MAG: carboxypeptidase-like regulatory domain-containing protein, partial [Planctomycetota bacterium]
VAESDTDRELAVLSSPAPSEPIAAPEPAAIRTPLQASEESKGIEVHVTDSGGQPIEGIGLYLKRGRQQQLGLEAQTNDKGIALFAGPFGDEEDVVLELHADRARTERFVYPNRERVVHWVLGEGQTVSGQVVDLEGRGVSGAVVYRINAKHHDRMQQLATSDSAGRFTLHHLEGELRFLARAKGYQPSEIERARRGEVELELGAFGVKVHGTVVDDQNQPVPHAWVAFGVDEDARDESNGSQRTPQEGDGDLKLDREGFFVRANAQGHFETDEVPRGHAVILARSAPESDRHLVGWSSQWITGDLVAPITVRVELAGTIHGQLTGPAGEPLEGFPFESQWEGNPE